MPSATRNSIRDLAIKLAKFCGVREWRFTRRDEDGRAYLFTKIIETADPINVDRLYVVAHECGHIALQHGPRHTKIHRGEYEAEQFAILLLRHFDVPVPKGMVEDGQDYVAWHIENDLQNGQSVLDRDSFQWAERFVAYHVRDAVRNRSVRLVTMESEACYLRLLDNFLTVFVDSRYGADGEMSHRRTRRISQSDF